MRQKQSELLPRLRAALQRHGCRVNSRTGMAECKKHIERITGKPLSETQTMLSQQLNRFMERGIAHGMEVRPFVELKGYTESLMRRQRLCEGAR